MLFTFLSTFMYAVDQLGLPWWLRQSACNAGDLGSIPGPERSPGKGNGLVMFLDLEELALCRGCSICPSSTFPGANDQLIPA